VHGVMGTRAQRLSMAIAAAAWPQQPSDTLVRRTIAAVFRQRVYDRSLRQSLWDRFWYTVFELLGRLLNGVATSGATRPIVTALLIAIAVLVIVRIAMALTAGQLFARRDRMPGGPGRRVDPWNDAQRLAAESRYTDAAHALYAALLEGVAQREDLRLHPSKTVGDYLRELKRRSSTLMPTFRDFARLYEAVVYGLGFCDRDRYERLYALASGMLGRAR